MGDIHPDPAFPEDMRERVEHFIANMTTKGDIAPYPIGECHPLAIARWALERDAVAQDAEWITSSEPCLPFKTKLGLHLNTILARAEAAEAKLAAGRAEAERWQREWITSPCASAILEKLNSSAATPPSPLP